MLFGVAYHLFARVVGIGFADACIKQTKEVVNLGDGANGGTRVLVHRFLFDGDDRTQTRDFIYVGTLHVADELPRVGRKTLHVTALAFGINGVESQRRLATAANARDDHQGIARNG